MAIHTNHVVFFSAIGKHYLLHYISIQYYLYSAFHDTIVAKQLYRKLSFYNRFIYFRNLLYYDKL